MSEKDDILIDAYLRGALSAEDKILLEERLKDINFQEQFNEAKLLLDVLKEEDVKKMKSRLQSIEKDHSDTPDSKHKRNLIKIGVLILAFLAFSIFAYILFKPSAKITNQEIYASYYEPYPNIIDPIVKGETNAPSVYQNYELKDYNKVIQTLSSKESTSPDEQFYLASAHLAVGNFSQAKNLLKSKNLSNKYADACQWYLALICIKENKSCQNLFNSIASDNTNIYNKKARELLIQL